MPRLALLAVLLSAAPLAAESPEGYDAGKRCPAIAAGDGRAWLVFASGSKGSWDVYASSREAK